MILRAVAAVGPIERKGPFSMEVVARISAFERAISRPWQPSTARTATACSLPPRRAELIKAFPEVRSDSGGEVLDHGAGNGIEGLRLGGVAV